MKKIKSEAKGMKLVLLLVVIVGLGAVVGAIVIGNQSFEGIVTEDPYEEGLKRDEIRKTHERLGWKVKLADQTFRMGRTDLAFSVVRPDGSSIEGAEVHLKLSRPNTDEYDVRSEVTETSPGMYNAPVDFTLFGNWDLVFDIRKEGDILVLTQRVFAEQKSGAGGAEK
jgi:nitrogen fixation protein FixH